MLTGWIAYSMKNFKKADVEAGTALWQDNLTVDDEDA
jgi:hypothetical protein